MGVILLGLETVAHKGAGTSLRKAYELQSKLLKGGYEGYYIGEQYRRPY